MLRDIGRSNDWEILHNATSLTSATVSSGDAFDRANPFDFATGSGGAAALTGIAVSAGDVIELRVTRAVASQGHFSGVTFTVVPEPGSAGLLAIGLLLLSWRSRSRTH